jgi:hypothetical protein
MQQFKIRKDGFKEIRNQILIRTIPLILIAATAGIIISSVNSGEKDSEIILPIFIPLVVLAVGFGLYRGVNRQKELFESYTLNFTNNHVTREQLNTPEISIDFNDIKEIVKNRNGSFTIIGMSRTDLICVPSQIENYDQVVERLIQIRPISGKSNSQSLQKYQGILVILVIGLMVCVYTVTNKVIVAVAGTLLLGLAVWSVFEVKKSKNIDDKTKRGMRWIWFVMAAVIVIMVMKLTGNYYN